MVLQTRPTLNVTVIAKQDDGVWKITLAFGTVFSASFTIDAIGDLSRDIQDTIAMIYQVHADEIPLRSTPLAVEGNPLKGEKRDAS